MNNYQIPASSRCYFAYEHFKRTNKTILLCCADEDGALNAYKQLLFLDGDNAGHERILHIPSFDTVPYDRVSPSGEILAQRSDALTKLAQNSLPKIVVTAAQNLLCKFPAPSVFKNSTISLFTGLKINIEELSSFLISNGYDRSASAVDSGDFAIRGEILDLVTHSSQGYRINFGWESIESIKEYDTYSQISQGTIPKLDLSSSSETLLNSETITNFKNNFLQIFGVNHIKSPMYESIIQGNKFHGYEHLLPIFYKQMFKLSEFLGEHQVIYDNLCIHSLQEHEHSYHDFYEARLLSNQTNPDSFYFAIPVDKIIISSDKAKEDLAEGDNILLEYGSNNILSQLDDIKTQAKLEQKTEFSKLFELIVEHKKKIPVILCTSESGKERIKNISIDYEYTTNEIPYLSQAKKNIINLAISPLRHGFISQKYLFITENDILGDKFSAAGNKSSKKKLKNILIELDNISEGELIVHKEHGIGKFEKIETIHLDKIAHDCLKIVYANNDIFYLPVENIDQIKKYGNDEANLDKLGGANWQKRKAGLKNRIKDIAKSLLKITAQRQLATTSPVALDLDSYTKFCNKFPYNETEDQISAIADVRADLESGKLMDRLICGDVGFGKTEVAMRAAFMAAYDINEDMPQIAIISPTTILCKQHYKSFLERFKDMGIKISQLSRLVKSGEVSKIKHAIADGGINIIIGTHALLATDIKFKNLKMVIIDEEQHFGVAQKERLKGLKASVHVLSLSATPIPRTLQMSMVGIKDLSLIATPPMDRLSVRTNVMPFDGVIIRDALMRERFRGGLSFYVVPRIKDIPWVEKQLKEFAPELKYKIAHGQLSPNEIDEIMNEFCDGKFDILVSTTIIESGIDIPIANTMIVHRADMLGLSQLYQLRGRVGRGKTRGYAYLTLTNAKKITPHSMKRLDILQNIDSLGAGFTIAGHDMDLRGFGNLVGSEQSGHIKEVGSELYQEMLDEAINELKNQDQQDSLVEFTPSINLGIAVLIPSSYIEDSSLRLAIYRRTGDLRTEAEIENFRDEMIDRFGKIPYEFNNLLNMVKLKNICVELKIESLDSGPGGFVLRFNKNFDVSNMVMEFVKKYPRHAKIKPDNKLIFMQELKPDILLVEAKKLLSKLGESK
ncbi:MAG: transcription-repair coupling factor [Rickettsiaceae bacterium]|nr:transcription-repair coupling factor [Rickettsiaceae bacterium]